VLFHLAEPAALLGIAAALVIGILVHDAAEVGAARLGHDGITAKSGRLTTTQTLDRVSPFSIVAMVIIGIGWAERVPMNDVWRRRRLHVTAAILAGPLAYLLLTTGALALFRLAAETVTIDYGNRSVDLTGANTFLAKLLLWTAITFGSMFILSLVPIPPLDGGRILFLYTPRTGGWEKARYRLTETDVGVAIILALLLLPVLFPGFPSVTGQLIGPLLRGLGHLVGVTL
jgi:Zn-dependent protease